MNRSLVLVVIQLSGADSCAASNDEAHDDDEEE